MFGFSPVIAVGTSLLVVFFNALSGTIAYARQKRINFKIGIPFAIATIPGSIIGAIASQFITATYFLILFSIMLIFVSISLMRGKRWSITTQGEAQTHIDSCDENVKYKVNMKVGIILSFFVGFISSLFGIGVGIIHVPFMIVFLCIPTHIATATSHFILIFTSLCGAGMMANYNTINYFFAAFLGAGVIVGAQFGAKLSTKVKSRNIELLLAIFLIFIAVRLIIGVFYN